MRIAAASPGLAAESGNPGIIADYYRGLAEELGFKQHKLIARTGPWSEAHVEAFMDFHNLDYQPPKKVTAGIIWVCTCPFDESHTGSSPALLLTNAGWLKWSCRHDSCQMKFRDFLMRINFISGKVFGFTDLKGQP